MSLMGFSEEVNLEERLNPKLTGATVNLMTYSFYKKYAKDYVSAYRNKKNYISSTSNIVNIFNRCLHTIRNHQGDIFELIKLIFSIEHDSGKLLSAALLILLNIIPALAVDTEVLDPIIIDVNTDMWSVVPKYVNMYKDSPIRPIIILLLDKSMTEEKINIMLGKFPLNIKVALHNDEGNTKVTTILHNNGADNLNDFMDMYASQCFCTCSCTKTSILINSSENPLNILSSLFIKCHSYLLRDAKKEAKSCIVEIENAMTNITISTELKKLLSCILNLYKVYAYDKGSDFINQALTFAYELSDPLLTAYVYRYAHFIPNTSYSEKVVLLDSALRVFNERNIIDHKLYCQNNKLTYAFYTDNIDIAAFNDLIGEAVQRTPGLAGMSILYTNAGTAELYNRNVIKALERYKKGLDYATVMNRPAQRIGLIGNIAITESLLALSHEDNFYIKSFYDIINMPNTTNLPFIQANGIMNLIASAVFENKYDVVNTIIEMPQFKEMLCSALQDNILGTGSLLKQIETIKKKSAGHVTFNITYPTQTSTLSGIREKYIEEHGFNPAIGNAWL